VSGEPGPSSFRRLGPGSRWGGKGSGDLEPVLVHRVRPAALGLPPDLATPLQGGLGAVTLHLGLLDRPALRLGRGTHLGVLDRHEVVGDEPLVGLLDGVEARRVHAPPGHDVHDDAAGVETGDGGSGCRLAVDEATQLARSDARHVLGHTIKPFPNEMCGTRSWSSLVAA